MLNVKSMSKLFLYIVHTKPSELAGMFLLLADLRFCFCNILICSCWILLIKNNCYQIQYTCMEWVQYSFLIRYLFSYSTMNFVVLTGNVSSQKINHNLLNISIFLDALLYIYKKLFPLNVVKIQHANKTNIKLSNTIS